MQFTESEIQEILRENSILKKDLADAREELEATGRLYDTMVVGTRNLLILIDEGSRSPVYVSPNVEDVLGLPRELVMSDIRELGPKSGDIPNRGMFDSGTSDQDSEADYSEILHSEAECIDRRTGISKAYHRSVARIEGIRGNIRYLIVYLDSESGTADNSRLHEILYNGTIAVHNRMLKGMSHDLRTPLNSIAGFVMLLMKNAENSVKVKEYAYRIGVSCQDLLVMINQIMEMSELDKNSAEADNSEFALGSTIEEVSELVKAKAQLKHQWFEVHTSGIEHDIFLGDKVRITEVLMNLLNNAVQYTPEGGEISLSVIGRKDGKWTYYSISPEGVESFKEMISSYTRYDNSRKCCAAKH